MAAAACIAPTSRCAQGAGGHAVLSSAAGRAAEIARQRNTGREVVDGGRCTFGRLHEQGRASPPPPRRTWRPRPLRQLLEAHGSRTFRLRSKDMTRPSDAVDARVRPVARPASHRANPRASMAATPIPAAPTSSRRRPARPVSRFISDVRRSDHTRVSIAPSVRETSREANARASDGVWLRNHARAVTTTR